VVAECEMEVATEVVVVIWAALVLALTVVPVEGEGDAWMEEEGGAGMLLVVGMLEEEVVTALVVAPVEGNDDDKALGRTEDEAGTAATELVELDGFTTTATLPGVQPGTRSAAEAGPGPSVTATHPGRVGRAWPSTFSLGKGFVAAHAFVSSSV